VLLLLIYLELEAESTAGETVEEQVDAVIDVHQQETGRLEQQIKIT